LKAQPVILETHGGAGAVFRSCYADVESGCVIETDAAKAEKLAEARPSWSVYQAKAEQALEHGAPPHLAVNFLDVDPYGEPWPVLDAFFRSERIRPDTIAIAVNDGLRQRLTVQGGWSVKSMRTALERWGNVALFERYLEICKWKLEQLGEIQRYRLTHWTGYHCGHNDYMTHYAAILDRRPPRRRARKSNGATQQ